MQPVKQDALDMIDKLPDDADMDEIMYRLYVLDKIRKAWYRMQIRGAVDETPTIDGVERYEKKKYIL